MAQKFFARLSSFPLELLNVSDGTLLLGISTRLYLKGISLVERHRAMKHVDALKRNIKYMVYTNERKLDSNKVESIIELMSRRERDEKQMRQQLLNQNGTISEYSLNKKECCNAWAVA